jgi:hypothetical protein
VKANRGEVTRVRIEGVCEEGDNFIAYVVYKVPFVWFIIIRYKLVYSASKVVYNSMLDFCFAFKRVKTATDGCCRDVAVGRTST